MASDEGRRAVMGEAIAAASARAEELAAGDEQLELLAAPVKASPREGSQREALEHYHRAPGRPPGAQNRSTTALRSYLLARGADPVLHLARWAQHTPETLAAELGCTQLEAFRELRQVWAELAPFLHSRMLPTDDAGKPVPLLAMFFGGANGAAGADTPPWHYLQQNQAVTGDDDAKSQTEKSHDGDK